MTRHDPTLILKHLTVLKTGRKVYDQAFKLGVNIIRGENGSGKSTIADFIFHALGGEVSGWREEALSCDFTYAEVEIEGESITLRREVAAERRRPINIYWGGIEQAQEHGVEGWEAFPFQASAQKESFTQVLFRLLGLPDVLREDLQARITMHQVLRLLYVDQRTPYDRIFLEDDWDQQLTRAAVGDLLLGTYDDRLYTLRLDVREIEEQLAEVKAELRSIGEVLGRGDRALTPAALEEAIENVKSEQLELQNRLTDEPEEAEDTDTVSTDIRSATQDLKEAQSDVRQLTDQVETIDFEIQDSADLIDALHRRLEALDDAETTRQAFGAAAFIFCPSCYSPLEVEDDQHCPVCKAAYGDGAAPNILRLRHELTAQLQESRALQRDRAEERERLAARLEEAIGRQEQLQRRLNMLSAQAVSSAEAKRAEIHRHLGYLERQIEDLEEKRDLARRLESLEERRSRLVDALEGKRQALESRQRAVMERREEVEFTISDLTVDLLKQDIPRERAFETAERVTFDFGKDSLAVDGRDNFAASSMVYLKNSFHLAILLASLQLDYMRYPRFALFDNVEDKGMEPERSHNFQQLVVDYSEESDVEHQVIMTTSMIHPDLEESEHVVGPHYTHENRTLDIST